MKQLPIRKGMDVFTREQQLIGSVVGVIRGWEPGYAGSSGEDPPVAYVVVGRGRRNPFRRESIRADNIVSISMERLIVRQ